MLTARYATRKTAEQNGADLAEFARFMADFGKRIEVRKDWIEIIEADEDNAGEIVDYAFWAIIRHQGAVYGEIWMQDMMNVVSIEDRTYSEELDEIEITGYPLHVARALRQA